MSIQELHYDFKFKVDKVDSLQNENFLPAEIDWILNEAVAIYIKQRFGTNNSKKIGFEGDQKRIQDLKSLHIKCPTNIQPAVVPILVSTGVYELRLSQLTFDFLFLTRGSALASKTNCGQRVISLKEVQNDDYNDVSIDPFWKPSFEWRECPVNFGRTDTLLSDKGSIYLYTNGDFNIDEVYIEYLKYPNKVSIGGYNYIDGNPSVLTECDLPEETHREIVDIAVTECSRIITNPNFLQITQSKQLVNE